MSAIPNDIMQTATEIVDRIAKVHPWKGDCIADVAQAILSERQRQAEVKEEVRKVLASSDALLKRMMHVHVAPDECKDETVTESRQWFYDNGGTLACLADQFEAIHALLSRLEER